METILNVKSPERFTNENDYALKVYKGELWLHDNGTPLMKLRKLLACYADAMPHHDRTEGNS